jgi:hypothetical protein
LFGGERRRRLTACPGASASDEQCDRRQRAAGKGTEAPLMQLNSAGPDLVRRLREGAEIAYREFVERYQSEVYRVAYGIMGHRNYADQVVEQVL